MSFQNTNDYAPDSGGSGGGGAGINYYPSDDHNNNVVVDGTGHHSYPTVGMSDFVGHHGQHNNMIPPSEDSALEDLPDILLLNHFCANGRTKNTH